MGWMQQSAALLMGMCVCVCVAHVCVTNAGAEYQTLGFSIFPFFNISAHIPRLFVSLKMIE